ncbi:hypothetical protein M2132_000265 [Dysgonomonas sp. PH5-45]|nr:hypothetical protein [Dysgonomonas sp. PH5-45]MDH6386847.1 hypothetical protein [Dysgonomonas sp. PH5-37]
MEIKKKQEIFQLLQESIDSLLKEIRSLDKNKIG